MNKDREGLPAGVYVAGGAALLPERASSSSPLGNQVLRNALDVAHGRANSVASRRPSPPRSSTAADQTGALRRRAAASASSGEQIVLPSGSGSCQLRVRGHGQVNSRVTQDCSLRPQPGTEIAIDPTNPDKILVGQNDSANRLLPLRRTRGARRRPSVGRPDPAVLPVPAARRQAGRGLRESDGRLGLPRELYVEERSSISSAPGENALVAAKSNANITARSSIRRTPREGSRSTAHCPSAWR